MKEELLKEAMDLAKKVRESYEIIQSQKESAPLESLQDMLTDLTERAHEFMGFYKALFLAGILNEEDTKEIYSIIPTESDFSMAETGLAPDVIDFIQGLEELDDLEKKQ